MKKIKFRLTGVVPLLMHNGQTADPLNHFSKAMKKYSSKRTKTDEDYEAMAKLEFLAGLYLNENKQPCIPGEVLEGALYGRGGAARKERAGKQGQAAVFCDGVFDLEYDGPKDPEEMWKDEEFRHVAPVRVQSNKVIRTRPKIPTGWTSEGEVTYNEKLVNKDEIVRWLKVAGEEIGLMDWRPKYGRFTVEILN